MDVAEAAAALRADLQLLDASAKEAAALLDTAAWQLGELGRGAAPMTAKTQVLARARANIQAARAGAEELLENLDTSRRVQAAVEAGPRADLAPFLAALQRLEAALAYLQAHRAMQSAEDALRHTAALRDVGLAAAAAEFSSLLAKHGSVPASALARLRAGAEGGSSASPSSADSRPVELVPEPRVGPLRALAAALLHDAGSTSARSCVHAYAEARRGVVAAALEPQLAPLGGSREELAKLSWQQVEARIPGWVAALRLYARLVQEEGRLCAAVFPPGEQAAVLSQVAASAGAPLVAAAEGVLAARSSPEKMFGLLEMVEGVGAALPPLRAALAAAGHSRLDRGSMGAQREQPPALAQLAQLRSHLAAAARACWGQLPDYLAREAARGVPPNASLHPLVATTMALLKRTLAFQSALPVLFGEGAGAAAGGRGGLAEQARLQERTAAAVASVLDALLSALDVRARAAYKHRGQAALHQMSNAAHVQHALGASRELAAAGEGWLEAHKGVVEEHHRAYVEAAWGPLLALLRADARQPLPPNLGGDRSARQAVKDKWAAVNKALAEVEAQQAWSLPDALRRQVRGELAASLAPLYDAFCAKYASAPYTDNHAKHEKVTPAELRTLLESLFEGGDGGAASLVGRSPSRSPGSSAGLSRRLSGIGRTP